MKRGDYYQHYKDVEYYFDGIALPLNTANHRLMAKLQPIGTARYHEDTHDLNLYQHMETGVVFILSDKPHVIYQSEEHYESTFVFAREVDDYFGYVEHNGTWVRRFKPKEKY